MNSDNLGSEVADAEGSDRNAPKRGCRKKIANGINNTKYYATATKKSLEALKITERLTFQERQQLFISNRDALQQLIR